MDENFDTGSILAQKEVKIIPGDTSRELKERTVFHARLLCAEVLKKLEFGLVIPVKQEEKNASYYSNIQGKEMMLDFAKKQQKKLSHIYELFILGFPVTMNLKRNSLFPIPINLK